MKIENPNCWFYVKSIYKYPSDMPEKHSGLRIQFITPQRGISREKKFSSSMPGPQANIHNTGVKTKF